MGMIYIINYMCQKFVKNLRWWSMELMELQLSYSTTYTYVGRTHVTMVYSERILSGVFDETKLTSNNLIGKRFEQKSTKCGIFLSIFIRP